jgi:hypothetical protein
MFARERLNIVKQTAIIFSLLMIVTATHPVFAQTIEPDGIPTARLLDEGPLNAIYPHLTTIKWDITHNDESPATLAVNISLADERGDVVWTGPSQHWHFRPFENHSFRTPFQPSDNLPASEYEIRVDIFRLPEWEPLVVNSSIGVLWVLEQNVSASFTSPPSPTSQTVVQGNDLIVTGSINNVGSAPARVVISVNSTLTSASTEIGIIPSNEGWYSLRIPTSSLAVGMNNLTLQIFSSQGGQPIDEVDVTFTVVEAYGELRLTEFIPLLASGHSSTGIVFQGQEIEAELMIENDGSLFCSGNLSVTLVNTTSDLEISNIAWYQEASGGVPADYSTVIIPIPIDAVPALYNPTFTWSDDDSCGAVSFAETPAPIEILPRPTEGVIIARDLPLFPVTSPDNWLFNVEVTNTGSVRSGYQVETIVHNEIGINAIPVQFIDVDAGESELIEVQAANPSTCFVGAWDLSLILKSTDGEIIDKTYYPSVLKSTATFGDGRIDAHEFHPSSALPGETVRLDVLINDTAGNCEANYLVGAMLESLEGDSISAFGETWVTIPASGSRWASIPLTIDDNALEGTQHLSLTLYAGEDSSQQTDIPRLDSFGSDDFEVIAPYIFGSIICQQPEYNLTGYAVWTSCVVDNQGNVKTTFRIHSESIRGSLSAVNSSVFVLPKETSQSLFVQLPGIEYGNNEIRVVLEALKNGVWVPIYNWSHVQQLDAPVILYPSETIGNLTISPNPPVEGSRVLITVDTAGWEGLESGFVEMSVYRIDGGGIHYQRTDATNWGHRIVSKEYSFTWPSDDCRNYVVEIRILNSNRGEFSSDDIVTDGCSGGSLPDLVPRTMSFTGSENNRQLVWSVENVGAPTLIETSVSFYLDGEFISSQTIPTLDSDEFEIGQIPVEMGDNSVLTMIVDSDDIIMESVEGAGNELSIHSDGELVFNNDVDGDGLSDDVELQGWEVVVVPSRAHLEGLVASLESGNFYIDPYVTTRQVTSSTSSIDSDGDGVSDLDEYLAATDPRNADTDGDGLSDLDEFGGVEATVVELQSPTIELLSLTEGVPSSGTSGRGGSSWHTLEFRVTDPNLQSVQVVKRVEHFGGLWTSVDIVSMEPIDIDNGLYRAIYRAPALAGYQVFVVAVDAYGNEAELSVVEDPSLFGYVTNGILNVLADIPLLGEQGALGAGILLGAWQFVKEIFQGLGALGAFVISLIGEGFIEKIEDMISQIMEVIQHLDLNTFNTFIEGSMRHIYAQAVKSNPYDTDSESFIFLWSFMSSYLFLTFYTALLPVTKLPKTISKIAKTIGSLVDDVKTGGFAAKVIATSTASKVKNLISSAIKVANNKPVLLQAHRFGLIQNIKAFISHPQRTFNNHVFIHESIKNIRNNLKGHSDNTLLARVETTLNSGLKKIDFSKLKVSEIDDIWRKIRDAKRENIPGEIQVVLSELHHGTTLRTKHGFDNVLLWDTQKVVYRIGKGGPKGDWIVYHPELGKWEIHSTKSRKYGTSPANALEDLLHPNPKRSTKNPLPLTSIPIDDVMRYEAALSELISTELPHFQGQISIMQQPKTHLYGPRISDLTSDIAADYIDFNVHIIEAMNPSFNILQGGVIVTVEELHILYPPHDEQSPITLALVALVSSLLAALGIGIWGWRRRRVINS